MADAVAVLVKFRDEIAPNLAWRETYRQGLRLFQEESLPGTLPSP